MKRITGFLFCGILLAGCGKVISYSTDFGSVNFINASPNVTGSLPQPGAHVFIDTVQKTSSLIAYRGASGYLAATPGSRNIQLRSSVDFQTKFYEAGTEAVESNKATTYIIYDTLSTANPKLKTVRLTDNLTVPDAGFANIRFVNTAINSGPLDVTFLRTSVTPNDSLTLTNQAYIGASPNAAALSAFGTKLPIGTYTIKFKPAGTQTVSASAALTLPVYSSIYTIFAAGTAAAQPLAVGAYRHYP